MLTNFKKKSLNKFLWGPLLIFGVLVALSKIDTKVYITKNGFSPNTVAIVKNTKIIWVNKDNLHWPASDIHPIHTQYPSKEKGCIGSALDSCRGLNKGESYSFVFDQAGTWGIHDHLFHTHTMTVKVYDNILQLLTAKLSFNKDNNSHPQIKLSNTPNISELISYCSSAQDRTAKIACMKEVFLKAVPKYGVKNLMSDLEQDFRSNDYAQSGGITMCHDIAHAIGQAGIIAIKNAGQVLEQCTDLCTSGCFHGAIEQYVLETSSDDLIKNMAILCKNPACFHGLGHGLASLASFDLGGSLELCDHLKTPENRRDCGFGVFMELYEPSSFNPTPLTPPADLLGLCFSLSGVYQEVCFRNIGTYEYARTNQDLEKAFAICSLEPTTNQRECRVALGQVVYFNKQGNAAAIVRICKNGSAEEEKDCIDGTLMASVSSDPLVRHGFEICSTVDADMQKGCYQFLGNHIQAVYGQQSRKELCNQLTGQNYNLCLL